MPSLNELIAQKEALERQIEATREKERAAAVEKVRALMSEYGLTVADLSARKAKKTGGTKVAAKYQIGRAHV